tara:strand:- start:401 stop:784 length:384 start_codon:yes stop_codon:yes gene_type:complete
MKDILYPSIVMLVLDFLWLTLFMGPKYKIMIPNIQGSPLKTNIYYAIIVYILMIIGQQIFVKPLINSYKDALIYGSLFGIILFGVYDFTAGAVIKNWDLNLALIDVLWGSLLLTVSSLPFAYLKLKN